MCEYCCEICRKEIPTRELEVFNEEFQGSISVCEYCYNRLKSRNKGMVCAICGSEIGDNDVFFIVLEVDALICSDCLDVY